MSLKETKYSPFLEDVIRHMAESVHKDCYVIFISFERFCNLYFNEEVHIEGDRDPWVDSGYYMDRNKRIWTIFPQAYSKHKDQFAAIKTDTLENVSYSMYMREGADNTEVANHSRSFCIGERAISKEDLDFIGTIGFDATALVGVCTSYWKEISGHEAYSYIVRSGRRDKIWTPHMLEFPSYEKDEDDTNTPLSIYPLTPYMRLGYNIHFDFRTSVIKGIGEDKISLVEGCYSLSKQTVTTYTKIGRRL